MHSITEQHTALWFERILKKKFKSSLQSYQLFLILKNNQYFTHNYHQMHPRVTIVTHKQTECLHLGREDQT